MRFMKRDGDVLGIFPAILFYRYYFIGKCKIDIFFLGDNEEKKNISIGKKRKVKILSCIVSRIQSLIQFLMSLFQFSIVYRIILPVVYCKV